MIKGTTIIGPLSKKKRKKISVRYKNRMIRKGMWAVPSVKDQFHSTQKSGTVGGCRPWGVGWRCGTVHHVLDTARRRGPSKPPGKLGPSITGGGRRHRVSCCSVEWRLRTWGAASRTLFVARPRCPATLSARKALRADPARLGRK